MNSRQSWLLSCLSEKNCRRCMYRYAWATRTLRAVVVALLALHADELADSCIEPPEALSFLPNPPTGPAFLFDALAVVFVLAEEPISARAKVLFLRVVVCLWHLPLFARSAASSKFAWRGRNAGPRGDVLQSRRRVGNACGPVAISLSSRDGLPAGLPAACAISLCCLRVALQSLRVAKFALSLILIICCSHELDLLAGLRIQNSASFVWAKTSRHSALSLVCYVLSPRRSTVRA